MSATLTHAAYCTDHVGQPTDEQQWCSRVVLHRREADQTLDIIVEQPPDREHVVIDLYATETALTPSEAREVALALLRAAVLAEQAEEGDLRPSPDCPVWCRDHEGVDPLEPDMIPHHATVTHGVIDSGLGLSQCERDGVLERRWFYTEGYNDINGQDVLDLIVALSKAAVVDEVADQ